MPHRDDAKERDLISRILKDAEWVPRESSPYLEPEDSLFSMALSGGVGAYMLAVATSLLGAAECEARLLAPIWQRDETASLVCLPSFEPEWALWVVGARRVGFWVLLAEADRSIWHSMRGELETPDSVPLKKRYSELSLELGVAVCDIWSRVLSQTRYPEKRTIDRCDGVSYHFAYSRKNIASTAGTTWSPPEVTIPGQLVGLSDTLREYVHYGGQSNLQIVRKIEEGLTCLQTATSEAAE
jgi:hypothetical protein